MNRIVHYLIAGGASTGINLLVFYAATSWLHIWYVAAAVLSFVIGFAASFTLQKFWTFGDGRKDVMADQAVRYMVITLMNLGLNALGLYALVEWLHVPHLIAQVVMLALIACESFFLYRLVFRRV